ncbi:MAG: hypothetical protein CL916_05420, partial [Deltaproteobacteria bacterium]|nr:hypothetical protein [Deltaproteobacteria bacterium]
ITQSITSLWDGTPLSQADVVHVHIHEHDTFIQVEIDAPYYKDPAPNTPPSSFWSLWDYEVVEVFFVGKNGQYLEAEFGPHGHHLLLWLSAPRTIEKKHLPVEFTATIEIDRWKGFAKISRTILPSQIERWNLFSIHGTNENRQYQCMSPLNTSKPDFHLPQKFPLYPNTI